MPAYLVTPSGSYRLHVQQWSAPIASRSGNIQVHRNTIPYTYGASQDTLTFATRCTGDANRQALLTAIRAAQTAYLTNPASKCTFWWPERNIAWEGVPTQVAAGRDWQDVAPTLQVTMLLTRNMVATQDGWVTGQDGTKHVVESVIDHVFTGAGQQFQRRQDSGTDTWKGVPYALPGTTSTQQQALEAGMNRLLGN